MQKTTIWKAYFWLAAGAGVIVALDQWTKSWVRRSIPLGETWLPESLARLSPYARLVHWYNKGAAFGMFQQGSLVFTVLAFVVVGAIFYFYPKTAPEDWWIRLALMMQLGGAVGNLIDRLTIGHVTDFISIGSFAVFNVADSAITVGTGILLLRMWWTERNERGKESDAPPSEEEAPLEGKDIAADG